MNAMHAASQRRLHDFMGRNSRNHNVDLFDTEEDDYDLHVDNALVAEMSVLPVVYKA